MTKVAPGSESLLKIKFIFHRLSLRYIGMLKNDSRLFVCGNNSGILHCVTFKRFQPTDYIKQIRYSAKKASSFSSL
jgi:hypothetical protein